MTHTAGEGRQRAALALLAALLVGGALAAPFLARVRRTVHAAGGDAAPERPHSSESGLVAAAERGAVLPAGAARARKSVVPPTPAAPPAPAAPSLLDDLAAELCARARAPGFARDDWEAAARACAHRLRARDLDELRARLDEARAPWTLAALAALARGLEPPESAPASALRALEDAFLRYADEPRLATIACRSLALDARSVDVVIDVLCHAEDEGHRSLAAWGLGAGPDEGCCTAIVARLSETLDARASELLLVSLESMARDEATVEESEGGLSSGALQLAAAAVEDLLRASDEPEVRRRAVVTLGALRRDSSTNLFIGLLDDSDPVVAARAAATLASLARPLPAELLARLERPGNEGMRLVLAADLARAEDLADWGREARGVLRRALADESVDSSDRVRAVWGIASAGLEDAADLDAVLRAARDHWDPAVRRAAISALGRGPATDEVVAFLRTASESAETPALQMQAANALGNLRFGR